VFSPLNFFGKEATLVVDRVCVCVPQALSCSIFGAEFPSAVGPKNDVPLQDGHVVTVTSITSNQLISWLLHRMYMTRHMYIYIYAMCVHIFSYGQLSYPIYLFIYFICIHAHICIHNIYTSILSLPFRTTFIIVWGWQRLRNRKQKSKAMESFWTPLAVAKDDLTFLGAAGGKCSDEGWLMRVYLI
jgi:hypothetical protein